MLNSFRKFSLQYFESKIPKCSIMFFLEISPFKVLKDISKSLHQSTKFYPEIFENLQKILIFYSTLMYEIKSLSNFIPYFFFHLLSQHSLISALAQSLYISSCATFTTFKSWIIQNRWLIKFFPKIVKCNGACKKQRSYLQCVLAYWIV